MEGNKKPEAVTYSRPVPKKRFETVRNVLTSAKKRYRQQAKFVKITFAMFPILIVLVIGVAMYKSTTKFADTDLCRGATTSPIYKEAGAVLNPQAMAKLKTVVDRIVTMKHYDRDPNCMYPITIFYINSGNAKEARTNYDKLARTYNAKKGFSKDLGPLVLPIDRIEQQVVLLEAVNQRYQQGIPTERGALPR